MDTVLGILGLVIAIVVIIVIPLIGIFGAYWMPTVVALIRKKHDRVRIVLLNLFLGWLGPIWIYICVCAFLDNPGEAPAGAPPSS